MLLAPRLLLAASLCALGCTGTLEAPTISSSGPEAAQPGSATEGALDGAARTADDAGPSKGAPPADAGAPPSSTDAGTQPSSSDAGTAGSEAGASDAPAVTDASATLVKHDVTFYGWTDNTPPSASISNPLLHATAGGVGTYADPITFATASGEWAPGTILYVPFLQKYVIMEDTCVACAKDWTSGIRHIDVWMKSDGSSPTQLLACEDSWTRNGADVETNPPPDRLVDERALFEPATATCLKGL